MSYSKHSESAENNASSVTPDFKPWRLWSYEDLSNLRSNLIKSIRCSSCDKFIETYEADTFPRQCRSHKHVVCGECVKDHRYCTAPKSSTSNEKCGNEILKNDLPMQWMELINVIPKPCEYCNLIINPDQKFHKYVCDKRPGQFKCPLCDESLAPLKNDRFKKHLQQKHPNILKKDETSFHFENIESNKSHCVVLDVDQKYFILFLEVNGSGIKIDIKSVQVEEGCNKKGYYFKYFLKNEDSKHRSVWKLTKNKSIYEGLWSYFNHSSNVKFEQLSNKGFFTLDVKIYEVKLKPKTEVKLKPSGSFDDVNPQKKRKVDKI